MSYAIDTDGRQALGSTLRTSGSELRDCATTFAYAAGLAHRGITGDHVGLAQAWGLPALSRPRTRTGSGLMACDAGRGGSRSELAVPDGDPAAQSGGPLPAGGGSRPRHRQHFPEGRAGSVAPLAGSVAQAAGRELAQLSARGRRLLPGPDEAGLALTDYADVLEHTKCRVRALRAKADSAYDEHARPVAASRGAGIEPLLTAQLHEQADRELEQAMGAIHRSYGAWLDELGEAGSRCARTLSRISATAGAGRGTAAVRADVLAGLPLAQDQIRGASTPPVLPAAVDVEQDPWWESTLEAVGDAAAWDLQPHCCASGEWSRQCARGRR